MPPQPRHIPGALAREMAMAVGVNPDDEEAVKIFLREFALNYRSEVDKRAREEEAKKKPVSFALKVLGSALGAAFVAILTVVAPNFVSWVAAHLPWQSLGGGGK